MRSFLIRQGRVSLRARQCHLAYSLSSSCGVPLSRSVASATKKRRDESIISPLGKRWSASRRIEVINEQFCEDVFDRVKPYLADDQPSIILDLNPGWGILSKTFNERLKPDLHVLVEPRIKAYAKFLTPLTEREGVELYGETIQYATPGIDWMTILEKHVLHTEAAKKKNILFLTNFTDESLKMVPKIWAHFHVNTLLQQTIFHDWRMRFIGVFDSEVADSIHPHQVGARKKVAIQNVAAAKHAFYVAESDNRDLLSLRGLETIAKSSAAAMKRAADANVSTPEGREPIQHEPISQFPYSIHGREKEPSYTTNPLYPSIPVLRKHNDFKAAEAEYFAVIGENTAAASDQSSETQGGKTKTTKKTATKKSTTDKQLKKLRTRYNETYAQYCSILRNWDNATILNDHQFKIDRLEFNLEAAWMNPSTSPEMLREMNSSLKELREAFDVLVEQSTAQTQKVLKLFIDNYRTSLGDSLELVKGSNLAWDSRPFEPLLIRPGDTYRSDRPCSIFFMESKSPDEIMKTLSIDIAHERLIEGIDIANSVIHSFTTRSSEPISFMLEKLFPAESCTDTIKAIPELFRFIPKQLRESAIHASPHPFPDTKLSDISGPPSPDRPTQMSVYDAFEYFPTQKRLNSLSPHVLFKLARRYMQLMPPVARSCIMVHRSLGGTAAQSLIRQWVLDDE